MKKKKIFTVSSKDLFDSKKNPKLVLSAKHILNNPKIKKKFIGAKQGFKMVISIYKYI